MDDLVSTYKQLINHTLPAAYSFPVCENHCFARIILDWLFGDCWYHHLNKKSPAFRQLTAPQLKAAIKQMNGWLQNQQLLIADNNSSLQYRKRK